MNSITIRVEDELIQKLDEVAKKKRISRSDVVRILLYEGVEREERRKERVD